MRLFLVFPMVYFSSFMWFDVCVGLHFVVVLIFVFLLWDPQLLFCVCVICCLNILLLDFDCGLF